VSMGFGGGLWGDGVVEPGWFLCGTGAVPEPGGKAGRGSARRGLALTPARNGAV
jgi:hypothetical protein